MHLCFWLCICEVTNIGDHKGVLWSSVLPTLSWSQPPIWVKTGLYEQKIFSVPWIFQAKCCLFWLIHRLTLCRSDLRTSRTSYSVASSHPFYATCQCVNKTFCNFAQRCMLSVFVPISFEPEDKYRTILEVPMVVGILSRAVVTPFAGSKLPELLPFAKLALCCQGNMWPSDTTIVPEHNLTNACSATCGLVDEWVIFCWVFQLEDWPHLGVCRSHWWSEVFYRIILFRVDAARGFFPYVEQLFKMS